MPDALTELPPPARRPIAAGRLETVTARQAIGQFAGRAGTGIEIVSGDRVVGSGTVAPGPDGLQRFAIPLPEGEALAGSRSPLRARTVDGRDLSGLERVPLPVGRPAKALVMIPAGQVYDHDKARLYEKTLTGTYANIGDMMVYESTLRMFDFSALRPLEITEPTQSRIDLYNAEYDFVFLRGSNFIHESTNFRRATEVLDRLKIPVIAAGVGAQAVTRRKIVLPPEPLRVWNAIADRCATIGVRGAYSAEVLWDNGIRNVEVVGCPSIFRARDPEMRLRRVAPDAVKKVAFSLRRETGHNYSRNVADYLSVQKATMLRLDRETDLTVTVHGELEERAFALRQEDRIEAATEELRRRRWFTPEDEEQMLRIYRDRLFFYKTGQEYDDFVRQQDMTIGYRVHGVLPALANGTPSILVDYDERSAELANTHRIPLVTEEDLRDRPWRELYAEARFDAFEEEFRWGYARMKAHLDRNGIPNRM
ncbi:polysaccharide pyruvyl transferase family protein [Muricoccus radiodurans]|uniref:polysaccharide pyruvyl transferase family protein n=1 Tax=Muricoccus radiodurans TaxID=2231721 RepID=UPI003CEA2B1B